MDLCDGHFALRSNVKLEGKPVRTSVSKNVLRVTS